MKKWQDVLDEKMRRKIKQYKDEFGMEAWELHTHAKFVPGGWYGRGSDGRHTVREMMETASKRGLDGLLITDHNSVENFEEAAYWADYYGIKTLPATEVSTRDGHVVGIFSKNVTTKQAREKIYCLDEEGGHCRWSANKVARKIHELGGVAILAHPYSNPYSPFETDMLKAVEAFYRKFDSRLGIPKREIENLTEIDGIEEINANLSKPIYSVSAADYGKAATAASDSHTRYSVGFGTTYMPATNDAEELLDHIRNRRTMAVMVENDERLRRIDIRRCRSMEWTMEYYMLFCMNVFLQAAHNKIAGAKYRHTD